MVFQSGFSPHFAWNQFSNLKERVLINFTETCMRRCTVSGGFGGEVA